MSQRWRQSISLVLTVIVISTAALFYSRPDTKAAESKFDGTTFIETFDGRPGYPEGWRPDDWDLTVHSRDTDTWEKLESMHAMHGHDCSGPPSTHEVDDYNETVFICNDHMMTALFATGYGMIYMTPRYMVNFTDEEAVIRFDVSTLRQSPRDWFDIWITPYSDNLQLTLDDSLPDVNGEPRRGIHIRMNQFNGETIFRAKLIKNHEAETLKGGVTSVGYESFLVPDSRRRDTFEIRISKSHIKFGMPAYNHWWVDSALPPMDWSTGVVQFGHHSYNPKKDCTNCGPNTWHWDNISISPAIPFTVLPASQRTIGQSYGTSVSFSEPAPSYAHLRFAGVGENLEVSYDGGRTWAKARLQAQEEFKFKGEIFKSYWTPVPAGTTNVQFRGQDWWGGKWHVRDVSIWSNAVCYGGASAGTNAPQPRGTYNVFLPALSRPAIC